VIEVGADTSYTLPAGSLAAGQEYYWRVEAHASFGTLSSGSGIGWWFRTPGGVTEQRGFQCSVQPNPARLSASIRFVLPTAGDGDLSVFNVGGRQLRETHWNHMGAGEHLRPLDLTDEAGHPPASGCYFLRLKEAGSTGVARLVLLR